MIHLKRADKHQDGGSNALCPSMRSRRSKIRMKAPEIGHAAGEIHAAGQRDNSRTYKHTPRIPNNGISRKPPQARQQT